jgi:carbamoyl-phosphate synthase large subunit
MAVYPGLNLTRQEVNTIIDYTVRIGLSLKIKGLMNIQYVTVPRREGLGSSVYVLEVNPRSSRTVPFLSKVTGVPMVKVATRVRLGVSLKEQGYKTGLWPEQPLTGIKAPVFSMSKLVGVDTYLGPEMKSTGEVMGIGESFAEAYGKAVEGAGQSLPRRGKAMLSVRTADRARLVAVARALQELGFTLYGTHGTARAVRAAGMECIGVNKVKEGRPHIVDMIKNDEIAFIVNTTEGAQAIADSAEIRRAALRHKVTYTTTIAGAEATCMALRQVDVLRVTRLQELY